MGKLRFGVAFAVSLRDWKGITPIPTASSGQALAFPHRGGRDKRKEASPEGGGNGGGELGTTGYKGKLPGIRHSGQSDEPLGRR